MDTIGYAQRALLPAGLQDVLFPDAAFEALVSESLVNFFAVNGYDRIAPPLIEFEETLLSDSGAATAMQVFRFMDPMSRRMMAVRADMTPQIARIAVTRLANFPRPLRLGYAGHVLRVKGTQFRPERQSIQAGAELIGSASPEADVEVISLMACALAELGIHDVSVDINLPTLVPAILTDFGIERMVAERLRKAIAYKDSTALSVEKESKHAVSILNALVSICGPVDQAVIALAKLDLPPVASFERDSILQVAHLLRIRVPNLTVTVDPAEHRGFEYHTGVSFAIFARSTQGELGRGGRYLVRSQKKSDREEATNVLTAPSIEEPAVGATLCVNAVLDALNRQNRENTYQKSREREQTAHRRLLIPAGTPRVIVRLMQAAGWITVITFDSVAEITAEAKRLGCSHILVEGRPISVYQAAENV